MHSVKATENIYLYLGLPWSRLIYWPRFLLRTRYEHSTSEEQTCLMTLCKASLSTRNLYYQYIELGELCAINAQWLTSKKSIIHNIRQYMQKIISRSRWNTGCNGSCRSSSSSSQQQKSDATWFVALSIRKTYTITGEASSMYQEGQA